MKKIEKILFDDGKYKILWNNGKMRALRHGEEWRDLVGDNLILALCNRIEDLELKHLSPTSEANGVDNYGNPVIYGLAGGKLEYEGILCTDRDCPYSQNGKCEAPKRSVE